MFTTYLWCSYLEVFYLNFHVSSEKLFKSHKIKTTHSNDITFGYFVEIIIRNWIMSFLLHLNDIILKNMIKSLIICFGDISFLLWEQTQIWFFFIFAKLQKYTDLFKIYQVRCHLIEFFKIFLIIILVRTFIKYLMSNILSKKYCLSITKRVFSIRWSNEEF